MHVEPSERDLADADLADARPLCRHWQSPGVCAETCGCSHGCGEHHDAGWCSRCGCLAWTDLHEAPVELEVGSATRSEMCDDWELEDVFEEELPDAAGW